MAKIVKVPRPDRTAFNPQRPLHKNQLLQAQVQHFQEADAALPPEFQTGIDIASIQTEGQVGDYIRRVTQAIHASGGLKLRKSGATG